MVNCIFGTILCTAVIVHLSVDNYEKCGKEAWDPVVVIASAIELAVYWFLVELAIGGWSTVWKSF